MLPSLKKKGKKLLVSIDEVVSTPQMRTSAATFRIFLRQDLPVFLLMTGLHENINALQNVDSLTFLYRAPKIEPGPLSIGAIATDCEDVLELSEDDALALAKETRGYSSAFRVLGFFAWENRGDTAKERHHL